MHCDRSDQYPFCDGTHKGSDLKSLRYEALKSGTILFKDRQVKEITA